MSVPNKPERYDFAAAAARAAHRGAEAGRRLEELRERSLQLAIGSPAARDGLSAARNLVGARAAALAARRSAAWARVRLIRFHKQAAAMHLRAAAKGGPDGSAHERFAALHAVAAERLDAMAWVEVAESSGAVLRRNHLNQRVIQRDASPKLHPSR